MSFYEYALEKTAGEMNWDDPTKMQSFGVGALAGGGVASLGLLPLAVKAALGEVPGSGHDLKRMLRVAGKAAKYDLIPAAITGLIGGHAGLYLHHLTHPGREDY